MIRKGNMSLLLGSIVALITVFAPASAAETTVGSFVQRLAGQMGIPAGDPVTAAESLSRNGILLPPDLDLSRSLTEGDVVAIGQAFGLRLRSTHPGAPFGDRQVDRFFETIGAEIAGSTRSGEPPNGGPEGPTPPFDPFEKGKGKGPPFDPFEKGKGKGNVTPVDPG